MHAQVIAALPFAGWMLLAGLLSQSSGQNKAGLPEEKDGADASPFRAENAETGMVWPGGLRIDGEKSREWKAPFGNTIRARLAGLSGATILLSVDGEPVAFPLAGFVEDDREYVRSVLRTRGQAGLFPGITDSEDEAARLVLTKREWRVELERWRKAVTAAQSTPLEATTARHHLRNIRDSNALEPLSDFVVRKLSDPVRTACVEAIAGIGGDETVPLLVRLATADSSGEVRASALWALCNLKDPQAALAEFASLLRVQRFRGPALTALGISGLLRARGPYEPPPPILETLIDILIVQEPVAVPYCHWEWWCIPQGSDGYHGHYHYERGFKKMRVPIACEAAHQLLVQQSGQDFACDRQRWRQWYADQKAVAVQHRDARRDDR